MKILTDEIKEKLMLKAHERLQEKHGSKIKEWSDTKYYEELKKEIWLIVRK